MTTASQQEHAAQADVEDRVRRGPSHAILNALEAPDVVLALWERSLPTYVRQGLDATASAALPDLDVEGTPDVIIAEAERAVVESGIGFEAVKAWLVSDLDGLVHRLSRMTGDRNLDLQLKVVTGDACRYFHIDAVPARLMCTYIGPGTQWIAPSLAGRESTGAGGTDCVLERPGLIHQMDRGAVAAFRGGLGPQRCDGLVHRSPPIEAAGARRYVLNITPRR